MDVALIVVRDGSARSGLRMAKRDVWRRIGICFWNVKDVEKIASDDLERCLRPLKGRFG